MSVCVCVCVCVSQLRADDTTDSLDEARLDLGITDKYRNMVRYTVHT